MSSTTSLTSMSSIVASHNYIIWCTSACQPDVTQDDPNRQLVGLNTSKALLASTSSYFTTTFNTSLKGETDEHTSPFNIVPICVIVRCLEILSTSKYDYERASFASISTYLNSKFRGYTCSRLQDDEVEILQQTVIDSCLPEIITAIDYYGFSDLFCVIVKCISHSFYRDYYPDIEDITHDEKIIINITSMLAVMGAKDLADLFLKSYYSSISTDKCKESLPDNSDLLALVETDVIPKTTLRLTNDAFKYGYNLPLCFLKHIAKADIKYLEMDLYRSSLFELSIFICGLHKADRDGYKKLAGVEQLYNEIIDRLIAKEGTCLKLMEWNN
jgi:hypothetical protein